MSRKSAREVAMHIVYEYGFNYNTASEIMDYRLNKAFLETITEDLTMYQEIGEKQYNYIRTVVGGIVVKGEEIDALIQKYSIRWNLERISRVARAILRVAVYEIKYLEEIPASVAINEAVEISKRYDAPETAAFINGILGNIVREETDVSL